MVKDQSIFNQQTLDSISKLLIKKGQTVAVAESVTAGNLQMAFSIAEGSTIFFPGGITVYNIKQKVKHLKVDPVHALACNCVSEQVSCEMAREVMNLFNSDWGIGITGYAAPIPEKRISHLYAWVAICHKEEKEKTKKIEGPHENDPVIVRNFYTTEVLAFFLKSLKGKS